MSIEGQQSSPSLSQAQKMRELDNIEISLRIKKDAVHNFPLYCEHHNIKEANYAQQKDSSNP